MFSRLLSLIRNNPDYFGSVVSAYGVVGCQVLVQLLLIPLYLSTLGKYQFGVLMLLISGVNVAYLGVSWTYGSLLRVLGKAAATDDGRAFADGYLAAKCLFVGYASFIVIAGAGLAWAVPGLVSAKAPAESVSGDFVWGFALAAFYFIVLAEFTVDQMALNARKRQVVANILLMVSLAVFVVLVIPWLSFDGRIRGVFGCMLAGILTARTLAWVYWRRDRIRVGWGVPGARLKPVFARFRRMAAEGYLLYGLILMALQTDVLLVGWLGGAQMAAEFVLVWKVAEVLIISVWRLSDNLQPDLVHADAVGDRARLRRIYAKAVGTVRLVALFGALVYGALGPWLVKIWVGADAAPDTPLGYALAGAAIFWLGSARLPQVFCYALGHLRPLIIVAAVELALKLVVIGVLFPRVGYLAPIIAISTVHLCGVAIAYARMRRSW